MDTYIVFQDRYPRPAPSARRADARLVVGLLGTLVAGLVCTIGPAASLDAPTAVRQEARLALKVPA